MNIIIYGTQYGTAKKYAEELSRRTEIPCVSYEEIDDINIYGTIIYISSLYAGGVKKQLPAGVYEQATVLHLRGAIDYTKLNFKHKTMMGLIVRKAKNLPEEKKNAEVRAMIETYNQVVDFVDYESLSSIIDELK